MPPNAKGRPPARRRPHGQRSATTTCSVADRTDWNEAFAGGQVWVAVNGRKRWPHYPTNDLIWAASIADWWCGGRRG